MIQVEKKPLILQPQDFKKITSSMYTSPNTLGKWVVLCFYPVTSPLYEPLNIQQLLKNTLSFRNLR